MPPTGNGKSSNSFSENDDEEKSEASYHSSKIGQMKDGEEDVAGGGDDDDEEADEETTSDPVVVNPEGQSLSTTGTPETESPTSLSPNSMDYQKEGDDEEDKTKSKVIIKSKDGTSSSAKKLNIDTSTSGTTTMPGTNATVPPAPAPTTTKLSFVTAGFQKKATPFAIKSWSALALTLDGRDKITKVFQYTCRFLGWYLASLAARSAVAGVAGSGDPNSITNYTMSSKRFTILYKALAKSRKAFRLGRSFIEFEKLRSMGLLSLIFWHLQQSLKTIDDDDDDEDEDQQLQDGRQEEDHHHHHHSKQGPPKTIVRRASSNIGWGPSTLADGGDDELYGGGDRRSKKSLSRSLSSLAYRKMYRPLLSRLSSTFSSTDTPKTTELWKVFGSALKILGLLGFWAGDNMNFLLSTGAFDDLSLTEKDRMAKRSKWQSNVSILAYQSYFGGSVAGLFTNLYAYIRFWKDTLIPQERQLAEDEATSPEDHDRMQRLLRKTKEKQFTLFLALLKSCCDVMVFSNMPGIDLHKRYRGKKNHEGFHCLCGLLSASTVIYNNFPDKK